MEEVALSPGGDEDLADVFSIDFYVVAEAERHFLVKSVDEKIEEALTEDSETAVSIQ